MGQFIQEGDRVMFETVVHVEKATRSVVIGSTPPTSTPWASSSRKATA